MVENKWTCIESEWNLSNSNSHSPIIDSSKVKSILFIDDFIYRHIILYLSKCWDIVGNHSLNLYLWAFMEMSIYSISWYFSRLRQSKSEHITNAGRRSDNSD